MSQQTVSRLPRPVDSKPAKPASFNLPDALSLLVAALMAGASLGGLFVHHLYRDNTWSTAAFRGTDLATLSLAVPTLLVALALARRSRPGARLVWLGVLGYNIYNYAFYLFGSAFNDFFLLYCALLALSLVTVILAVPGVAPQQNAPGMAARLVGGYMMLVAAMFAAMWTVQAVSFIAGGKLPKVVTDSGIQTSIVFALDLTLIVPAFATGAILLWARRPWGLVFGVGLNVLGALYMAALAAAGAFMANAGIANVSWSAPPYLELGVMSLASAAWLLVAAKPWRPRRAG